MTSAIRNSDGEANARGSQRLALHHKSGHLHWAGLPGSRWRRMSTHATWMPSSDLRHNLPDPSASWSHRGIEKEGENRV